MAQNVTIAGASYTGVPAIDVALTSGGKARFVDTSDATATSAKILAGSTAYVKGSKITGTYSPEIVEATWNMYSNTKWNAMSNKKWLYGMVTIK